MLSKFPAVEMHILDIMKSRMSAASTDCAGLDIYFYRQFFRWYNLFALFWVSQFILSCQDLVVGGAISKWFFTRYYLIDMCCDNYLIVSG